MKAGVLGLGIIGSAWARSLDEDGLLAGAWNRTPKPDFPKWRGTPAGVAEAADLLIICVTDPAAVAAVLDAITLSPRHMVVQTSTIDPSSSRKFCARVRKAGAAYIEAPFTGSRPAAEQRKTMYFLGGRDEDIDRAEPVLSRISETRHRLGTPAQASAFKLSLNLLVANYAEALCESLNLSRRAGIPDDAFFSVMKTTVGWGPFATFKESKLRNNDFSTQFSVKNMLKDMRLALKTGGRALPLTRTLTKCLQRAADAGFAEEDYMALMKLLVKRPASR